METDSADKRKWDAVVRDVGDALESALTANNVEGARAILFHALGKAGLSVDDALAVFRRRDKTEASTFLGREISIMSAICERNEVLLLSQVLQFLEENNRLSTINDGDHLLLQRGQTPLWNAGHCGSLEAATLLLEKGADLNKPDENGWTPLHAACRAGHDTPSSSLSSSGWGSSFAKHYTCSASRWQPSRSCTLPMPSSLPRR